MSRSVKKGPFVDARLLGRVDEMNKRSERKVLKTWSRASVIFPQMIGHTTRIESAWRYTHRWHDCFHRAHHLPAIHTFLLSTCQRTHRFLAGPYWFYCTL